MSGRKMVDSGVEWIGDVPEGWDTSHLKDVASFSVGKTPDTSNPDFFDGGLPWITITDLDEYGSWPAATQRTLSEAGVKASSIKPAKQGSLLVSFKLSIGKISIAKNDVFTNEAVAAVNCHPNSSNKYFRWSLPIAMNAEATENIYGAKIYNQDQLGRVSLPLPPLAEQQAIANFLDHHVDLIDRERALIAKKIELLKDKRQAAIFECVTGKRQIVEAQHLAGVDDWSNIISVGHLAAVPTAEDRLVDSGVEWIGEVPEGWRTIRLGDIAKIETGSMNTEDRDDNGRYPLYVRSQKVEKCNKYTHNNEAILVPGEGLIGQIFHLAKGEHAVHQRVYSVQPQKDVEIRFVRYSMVAGFGDWAKQHSNTVTVESLRRPTFTNFAISMPCADAQTAIANFLDPYTNLINREIALLQAKSDTLSAKRQALIFDVVTGKIDIGIIP